LSDVANETESKRWNDERWTDSWPQREKLTDAVSPFLIAAAAPGPGQRICDIGCGGGGLSIALAPAVAPGGEVVGYDISAPLLALAQRRAADAGVTNLRFVAADVQAGEWNEAPADLAVSQFGVMFFDEPTAAFTAIRRHLVPGGRLVFACWQGVERNPWHLGTSLRGLVPPPRTPAPGKSPVGPFALGDDEYVRELLEAAGYGVVHGTPHQTTVRAPGSAVVDPSLFDFMGVAPEREDEAVAIARRHLERFSVRGTGADEALYDYPLAFTIYEAATP
jgi:SAM-dependent methyltransferase